MSGVKGIIGMHRFNFCLVLSLSCSGVKTPYTHTKFYGIYSFYPGLRNVTNWGSGMAEKREGNGMN